MKKVLKRLYERWITPKYDQSAVLKVLSVMIVCFTGPKMMWASWDTVLFWIVFDIVLMVLASRAMVYIAEWDNKCYKKYTEKKGGH